MNRDEIRRRAYERMASIETRFAERDLPRTVLAFYLLTKLIWLEDLDEFIHEHGERAFGRDAALEGKRIMGWGDLSPFEEDTCALFEIERTSSI